MDECIHHCCHDDKCDVSFMIQGNCYAVECADTEGCQVKRAKPSAYHPTVAYVYRGNGRPIGGKWLRIIACIVRALLYEVKLKSGKGSQTIMLLDYVGSEEI